MSNTSMNTEYGLHRDGSGNLQNLRSYLNGIAPADTLVFGTVADMIAAVIQTGAIVQTRGYNEIGDGGHGLYVVTESAPAFVGDYNIQLNGTQYAVLLHDGTISMSQAGGVRSNDNASLVQRLCSAMAAVDISTVKVSGMYNINTLCSITTANAHFLGGNNRNDGFAFTSAGAHLSLDGAGCSNVTFENIHLDGEYTANYCVRTINNSFRPLFINCYAERAEIAIYEFDEETTAWELRGGEAIRAGNRSSDGSTIITPNATCVLARCIGEISGGFQISNATGRGLRVVGNAGAEETRVNFIGGRINFCYGGLMNVNGDSHNRNVTVNLIGTYLENPGLLGQGQSNTSDIASIQAEGVGARVYIINPLKHLIRNAKWAYRAVNGAEINVDSNSVVRAQRLGSPAKAIYAETSNGGRVTLRKTPDFMESDDTVGFDEWDSFATATPTVSKLDVSFQNGSKMYEILDGTSVAGITTSAGSVSVANTNFITNGSSIKFEADGVTTAPSSFSYTFTPPPYTRGKWVAIVSQCRMEGDGVWDNPTQRLRTTGAGIFPQTADTGLLATPDPGTGVTAWYYFVNYLYIEDNQDITITQAFDTTPQITNDILYCDRVVMYDLNGDTPAL